MGYDRIIDWVEDHFKPSDYADYFSFEQAIRQRFNADGIDLPKGAESQMMDHFESFFEKTESPIISPTLASYSAPEPEILQISSDFFAVGAPFQEPKAEPVPQMFRDVPSPKVSFFGKVSGFFKRMFGL